MATLDIDLHGRTALVCGSTARPTSLLRRFITVEEVANAIVYLSSPAASATTGTAMRVDGGVARAIP